ncbi:MAG: hypothetical protein OEV40_29710 [Acidimicrobiia bacterium]|nr:hypothetical protein [Acidimicrobiia bacterium]
MHLQHGFREVHGRNRFGLPSARTSLWRRLTALFSLGSLVVLIGVLLAVIIGASALLLLFVLDRAIAG